MANKVKVSEFGESLVKYLQECLPSGPGLDREKMWSKFHIFRTSKDHFILWNTFLKNSIKKGGPIFLQHITNYMFKQLVKKRVPVATSTTSQQTTYSTQSLTYDEKKCTSIWCCWLYPQEPEAEDQALKLFQQESFADVPARYN